jgi:hypothetical protein
MRQQIIFKRKMAAKFALTDQLLRQQKLFASPWAGLTKQILQIVPERTIICASNLQVNFYNYKCRSVLISILRLTVILTVILFRS